RRELELARADFEQALRGAPDSYLAGIGRARVLEQLARTSGRTDAALAALAAYDALLAPAGGRAVAVTPRPRVPAQLGRDRALLALGRTEDARAALDAALALRPSLRADVGDPGDR